MQRGNLVPTLLGLSGLAVATLSGAVLMSFHAPLQNTVDAGWLAQNPVQAWTATYFTTANCRCSERVLQHLAEHGRERGVNETVAYFGPRPALAAALEQRGFTLRSEQSPEASGVLAAPWLLVRAASGRVQYSGGWYPSLIPKIVRDEPVAAFATPGCVASRKLRSNNMALNLKEILKFP